MVGLMWVEYRWENNSCKNTKKDVWKLYIIIYQTDHWWWIKRNGIAFVFFWANQFVEWFRSEFLQSHNHSLKMSFMS